MQIIEITPNGDPFGSGFVGTEYQDQTEYESGIGIHRGDLGVKPRRFWRLYCKQFGYILRYRD